MLIGGTTAGAGNVISGNKASGIDSFVIGSSGITIQGNLVGLDATGTQAMGNGSQGVRVSGPTDVVIGGATPGARNVISNNGSNGITTFAGAINFTVQGNYIGTDITATTRMGNHGAGIFVWSPDNFLIGGTTPGDGNVIVNNTGAGIETFANGNGALTVEGNFIGTDPTGKIAMGNGAAGVDVTITNTTVGGTTPGAANVIANNGFTDAFVFSGVRVTSSGIPILSNSIYNNKQLGIDLNNGGGNRNQPAPVVASASSAGASTTITGSLTAAASTVYTIQFFANTAADPSGAYEGQTYLGSTTVTTNASGVANYNASFSAGSTANQFITATATDPTGDTSQFSAGTMSVAPKADLALTTSASASTVNVNQDVTYTLTVTNNGPNDATNAILTDNLPAALTFISATTTQGSTPTDSNGTVTANFGTIASGATVTVTITVQTTVAAAPSVTSNVDVSSALTDPNPTNNTAKIVTTVNPLIDLAVTGSGNSSTALAGNQLTYTFTVNNNGPSPATNVVFTQDLPAGVTVVSANSNVGTASQAAGVVTADIGDLAANATATITVVVIPGATNVPSISSTGSATAAETDTNPANNTATVRTTITPAIDLAVGILANPAPVGVGQNLTYVVTVTNNGPSPATNVVLTQYLPSNVTLVSDTPSTGTASVTGVVVTGDLGTLASGASATLTVVVTPNIGAVPFVMSTAIASAAETETNASNNTASVTTTVSPVTDLAVAITPNPSPVDVGQNLTYTVTVTNNGPNAATGVVLTDNLPATATFVSANSSTGGSPTFATGTLTTDIGALPSGATATITIVVTPTAASAPSIIATASAQGNELDPNSANNTASVTTTVTPVADLEVTSINTSPSINYVDQSLTYTIVVTNNGPSPAAGVVLTQNLPAGFAFVSATSSAGTASQAGGVVTADLGALASGATATITVVATPGAGAVGLDTSTAKVSTTTLDPNSFNNTKQISTPVVPVADLALTLTASASSVDAGVDLTYTLVVTNNGPNDATGVVLSDTLPVGAEVLSDTSDIGLPPVVSNGQLTAAIGNLASGASATVTIVILPNVLSTSAADTASVAANEYDPNTANNSASATTTIVPAADLGIVLKPQSGPEVTGSPFVYTVTVTNSGPSDATNVNVSANLPAGVNFTAADPRFQSVAVNNGVLTLGIGSLNAGASVAYTFTVTPVTPGSATVSVTVSADQVDPFTVNNTTDATTDIVTPPGTLAFSAGSYQVNETDGFAYITVNRLNGYQGKVSVHFAAAPGTAKAGLEFVAVNETLIFGQGETSKTLAVPVLAYPYENRDLTVVLSLDTPTGGSRLGDESSALMTIHNPNPITVGPTVTDVRLIGPARTISQIDVVTTGALDPSTVTNLGFIVTDIGTFGSVRSQGSGGVTFSSVSYNAGLGIVSLTPTVPLQAGHFYQIRIVGTGPNAVTDRAGNPLNSTFGTTPGSDVVETFARGNVLNYVDENGSWVTLRIRGGGVIDLNRDAAGHVARLQVLGAVPRRTSLSGTVHTGNSTTIGGILGLGPFGTLRRNLNVPTFQVTNVPYSGGNLLDPPAVDTLLQTPRPLLHLRSLKAFSHRRFR